MTSLTMSAGSNENRTSGISRGELLAEPLLEASTSTSASSLEGDAEDRLLGPAGPLVDGVDRVARRDQPDVADGDLDRVSPTSCVTASSAAMAICSVFSIRVPVGACMRSWNRPASTLGKISRPELAGRRRTIDQRGRDEVGRHDQPAQPDEPAPSLGRRRRGAGRRATARRPASGPRAGACSSQVESTGTNVLESRYEATIAKPTASESGTNRAWAAPCMKNDGMNTARMQSIASSRGTAVSQVPLPDGPGDRVGAAPSCGGCSRSRRSPRRPGCRSPAPARRAS